MDINITVFIQACNFFISYWIVRRFFFRPSVTILEQEGAEKGALIALIDQQKQSIAIQQKARQQQWYECQEYFKVHRPIIDIAQSSVIFKESQIEVTVPEIPHHEIVQYVSQIKEILEEKIKHVQ